MNWIVQPQYPDSNEQPLTCDLWFVIGFGVGIWILKECKGEGALCSEFRFLDTGNCD